MLQACSQAPFDLSVLFASSTETCARRVCGGSEHRVPCCMRTPAEAVGTVNIPQVSILGITKHFAIVIVAVGSATVVTCMYRVSITSFVLAKNHENLVSKSPLSSFAAPSCRSRASHEEDSNAYVWSYAKRAIGTHVLRQKHWPGNAMMHPPDPNTFATSVAVRSDTVVGYLLDWVVAAVAGLFAGVLLAFCGYFWIKWQQRRGADAEPNPT